ncbi:MAG: FAD-binding oxidoreductase [Alphaproteobacteria bacterium]|nr:FAD-binding oxidoreductase [Alphaproteobacteria bacterium]
MSRRFDIAIAGAGMAGASLAAAIGEAARVVLLEAEAQPGYHATGRSAAFWSESYGGPFVQPLTTASEGFLSEHGFLRPRGGLHLAPDPGALAALAAEHAGRVRLEPLGRAEIAAMVPGVRPGWDAALYEPSCRDIDVAALHAFYLAAARRAGAVLLTDAALRGARREAGRWRLDTAAGAVEADLLVDAAGAWADAVAGLAGARPLGIRPYRRTVAQLRVDPPAPADLPLVMDAAESFYFKPEAGGRIWLSPQDETPCPPGDCAAEEIDVAVAIDRLEQAVDWKVLRVERAWAGLRSFAPDRLPVYGFDARAPGFFWCAGQGGFGIQTAPAAADLAAGLLLGRGGAADAGPYRPTRFSDR